MIRSILFFALIAMFLSSCGAPSNDHSTPNQTSSLPDGWEGNSNFFNMEQEIILAGSESNPIPQNEFLCTEESYSDFEISLEAKLTGEGKNAGIQIRSTRIPDHHEVIGYQCDIGQMEGRPIWGSLYDESRRKRFLSHPPADSVQAVLRNDWNTFVIRAEGPRIQIWLNGYQTVDYTEMEENISLDGKICLQIHSGPPAIASYRNIKIREL